MNKALKITLISAGAAVSTGIISAISYIKGKGDGIKLTHKYYENLQTEQPTATNRSRSQPQA